MKKLLFCGLLAALTITPAFAGEVLVNGDFEGGTLGPWYTARTQYCGGICVDWALTDTNFHSPTHSAVDTGNIELRQDFAGVAGSSVTSVTFWVDGVGVNAVDFFYSDSSDEEFITTSTAGVWQFIDVTSLVDTSKTLTGFSIWGTDPSAVTYVDDASITASGTTTPEPATLIMLGSGVVAAFGAARRRIKA